MNERINTIVEMCVGRRKEFNLCGSRPEETLIS